MKKKRNMTQTMPKNAVKDPKSMSKRANGKGVALQFGKVILNWRSAFNMQTRFYKSRFLYNNQE
jgi:hypothetical protein